MPPVPRRWLDGAAAQIVLPLSSAILSPSIVDRALRHRRRDGHEAVVGKG
jgi:hypothetical protein